MQDDAFALATRLAAGPTRALGLARRAINAALDTDYQTALAREANDQREAMRGPDAADRLETLVGERIGTLLAGGMPSIDVATMRSIVEYIELPSEENKRWLAEQKRKAESGECEACQ